MTATLRWFLPLRVIHHRLISPQASGLKSKISGDEPDFHLSDLSGSTIEFSDWPNKAVFRLSNLK